MKLYKWHTDDAFYQYWIMFGDTGFSVSQFGDFDIVYKTDWLFDGETIKEIDFETL